MQCSSCQGPSHLCFKAKDYNRKTDATVFDYYRCSSCDLVFLHPQPGNMSKYYQTEFYYIPSTIEELCRNARGEKYKVKLIQQFVSSGTLLDIGPGPGGFLYWAKQEGFTVEALEMNQQCCQFISDVLKIPAIQGESIQNDLPEGKKYDIISLWHVLEHLAAPWKALEEISERLHPGGLLVIAMPNRNSFQFKVLGRYWPHVDAPRHFQLIPDALLISSLKRLGYTLLYKTTNDEGGRSWNRFGWDRALKNRIRSRWLKKVTKLLSLGIYFLLWPFERREGQGTASTLIFKKEDLS
jgi:SAM-dependent methyltransferase